MASRFCLICCRMSNAIFIAASNSELAFTIIINSPQTKLNSDRLSGFIGGIKGIFSSRSLSSLLFWTPFQKVVEQTISHPLPDALKLLCADNMRKVSAYCHFMAGNSLHFFLCLRHPLAPRFARRLARGLRPLELTASLLVFVATNTNWSCLRRRLVNHKTSGVI